MSTQTTAKTIRVHHIMATSARWNDEHTGAYMIVHTHPKHAGWATYQADDKPIGGGVLAEWLADNYIRYANEHDTRAWVAAQIDRTSFHR